MMTWPEVCMEFVCAMLAEEGKRDLGWLGEERYSPGMVELIIYGKGSCLNAVIGCLMSGQFQNLGIVIPQDSHKRCVIHPVPVNTVNNKPVKRKIIIDIRQQRDLSDIVRGLNHGTIFKWFYREDDVHDVE